MNRSVAVRAEHGQIVQVCVSHRPGLSERHDVMHLAESCQLRAELRLEVEIAHLATQPASVGEHSPLLGGHDLAIVLPAKVRCPLLPAFLARDGQVVVKIRHALALRLDNALGLAP